MKNAHKYKEISSKRSRFKIRRKENISPNWKRKIKLFWNGYKSNRISFRKRRRGFRICMRGRNNMRRAEIKRFRIVFRPLSKNIKPILPPRYIHTKKASTISKLSIGIRWQSWDSNSKRWSPKITLPSYLAKMWTKLTPPRKESVRWDCRSKRSFNPASSAKSTTMSWCTCESNLDSWVKKSKKYKRIIWLLKNNCRN